ncbi:MAG: hypothetical protein IK024_03260 [Treponema sp.]|nr:hypothetical protein [Treponema sp.]
MKKFVNALLVISLAFIMIACGNANTTTNDENNSGGNQNGNTNGYTSLPDWITKLPVGTTDGTAGTNAEYVLFGEWPQTIKAGSVTVDTEESKTVGMFTYYKGDDGEWYCQILEHSYGSVTFLEYSDGTTISPHSAMSYKWFKVEPIKWRVITKNYKGKILLLAENGLIGSYSYQFCYDMGNCYTREIDGKTVDINNYKYSTVRACLNGLSYEANESGHNQVTMTEYDGKGFLQTAFTLEEQQRIVTMQVDNGVEKDDPKYEVTSDKLFCLEVKDVLNSDYGFSENGSGLVVGVPRPQECETRLRKPVDFVLASGPYSGHGESIITGSSSWYLRTSEEQEGFPYIYRVDWNGNVCTVLANQRGGTIVPALCIDGE